MFRNLFYTLSFLALLGYSASDVQAQDEANPQAETKATAAQRQLVQLLGDDSYIVRNDTYQELARQGEDAKDALIEARENPDPEIRWRAQLLLNRMDQETPPEETVGHSAVKVLTAAQRKLVQQLGDDEFYARERAEEELIAQGSAARAVLAEALADPDLEIRCRAQRILSRIQTDEFEARLIAFVADSDGSAGADLPGWKQFQDLVGNRRETRDMFAQMTRCESSLLLAYENQSPEFSELFDARVEWLDDKANDRTVSSSQRAVPLPSMAVVLLIGGDKTAKGHSQTISKMYMLLREYAVENTIGKQVQSPIMKTLLERWTSAVSSGGSSYGMMIALKYELKDIGLKLAIKLLAENTTSSSTNQYTIITVGRFGSKEHVPLLAPLMTNKTVCHRWIRKEGPVTVQIRDVALVVTLHLSGKSPEDYGFNLLRKSAETLYSVYTFGFEDDKEREAAHARWAADSKGEKSESTPAPETGETPDDLPTVNHVAHKSM